MIYLVRHGETAHNRDGLGLGRADVELTELGRRQAEAVGARFSKVRFDRILSSPLQRARDVAAEIARQGTAPVEAVEALTELDVGETEGMLLGEVRTDYPDFIRAWASADGHLTRMPGGESMVELDGRIASLAEELVKDAETSPIVVVSHNFVLRALLCRLLGLEVAKFRSFELGLASVSTIAVRNGRVHVRNVNDTCHLGSLNLA